MSIGNRRTRYTQEFKEHAIALADESGKPVGQVEAELGVGRGQISRRRRWPRYWGVSRGGYYAWLNGAENSRRR